MDFDLMTETKAVLIASKSAGKGKILDLKKSIIRRLEVLTRISKKTDGVNIVYNMVDGLIKSDEMEILSLESRVEFFDRCWEELDNYTYNYSEYQGGSDAMAFLSELSNGHSL